MLFLLTALSVKAQETEEGESESETEAENAQVDNKPSPIPKRAAPPDLEKESQRLIREQLKDTNLVTLNAAGEDFLAIWKQDITGNPFGAAVILHGEGQTADWPNTITALRKELANHGWSTLSISLPNPQPISIPSRPKPTMEPSDSEEETPDAENTIAATPPPSKPQRDIEAIALARLKSAIAYLNKEGQFNIALIGNGLGAARATQYIYESSGNQSKPANAARGGNQHSIRALVMVGARNVLPGSDSHLPELLSDPKLPVLDLVFNDHYLDIREAKARKQKAKSLQIENYFQTKLLPPSGFESDETNRMVKRVRGFLNRYAKGVEVAK